MWPFDRKRPTPRQTDALVDALTNEQRAVDAIYRRLQLLEAHRDKALDGADPALLERLTKLEARLDRDLKGLEIEWTSWYDKFRQLYNRLAKRKSRGQNEDEEAQETVEATNGAEPPPDPYQPPEVASTSHLARRFRSF
jgi:hypothetical protein